MWPLTVAHCGVVSCGVAPMACPTGHRCICPHCPVTKPWKARQGPQAQTEQQSAWSLGHKATSTAAARLMPMHNLESSMKRCNGCMRHCGCRIMHMPKNVAFNGKEGIQTRLALPHSRKALTVCEVANTARQWIVTSERYTQQQLRCLHRTGPLCPYDN